MTKYVNLILKFFSVLRWASTPDGSTCTLVPQEQIVDQVHFLRVFGKRRLNVIPIQRNMRNQMANQLKIIHYIWNLFCLSFMNGRSLGLLRGGDWLANPYSFHCLVNYAIWMKVLTMKLGYAYDVVHKFQ